MNSWRFHPTYLLQNMVRGWSFVFRLLGHVLRSRFAAGAFVFRLLRLRLDLSTHGQVSHSDDNGVGRAGLVPLRDGGSKGCLRYFQPEIVCFVPAFLLDDSQSVSFNPPVSLSGNRALGCCSLQRFIYYIIVSVFWVVKVIQITVY